jgi:hypothetical protein
MSYSGDSLDRPAADVRLGLGRSRGDEARLQVSNAEIKQLPQVEVNRVQ